MLHIISFDVPFPDDYGGVIEVFHTIRSLHELGVSIHLHCYEYGRGMQPELNRYCASVNYYTRKTGHGGVSLEWPYIMASRKDETLMQRLLQDNYPILLEGLHCAWPLFDSRFTNRKMVLRAHNVEFLYYRGLARSTSKLLPKCYYWWESRLLKPIETKVAASSPVLAFNDRDARTFRELSDAANCRVIPPFIPYGEIKCQTGVGYFCLYHGNLSVPENDKAARFLLRDVFGELNIPFVVAGKNPSRQLERLAHRQKHTCLVANPGPAEINDLIQKAQINILPAFNATGIKLKLINAIYNGRHCIVNDAAVSGTGLEPACHIAGNPESFKSLVLQLFHRPFEDEEVLLRKKLTQGLFDNKKNGEALIKCLW